LDLNTFDFRNGQFTCFFRTRNNAAWRQFDQTGISNNHLITDDGYLRDLIDNVQIGDQIRLQGWLASYGNDDGFHRGTSTTRTDEGNGACETIYVTDFDILSSMANGWRSVFRIALFGVLASVAFWLIAVMRGGFRCRVDRTWFLDLKYGAAKAVPDSDKCRTATPLMAGHVPGPAASERRRHRVEACPGNPHSLHRV
ncbi:MAG: hypothetical protein VB948_14300, partial [Pseudomonadales bacterium]